MRSRLGVVLGSALAIGLLAWLIVRLDDREALVTAFSAASRRPIALLGGLAFFGLCLGCGTLRWQVMLRSLSLPIPARRALQLYAVGHFFNVVVPGATGGDVVKATCAAVDSPGRRPEAVASILAERIIGLLALCVLVAAVALALPGFYESSQEMRMLRGVALLLGGGALVGAVLVFGVDWTRWIPSLDGGRRWHAWLNVLLRAYRAIRICAAHPRALAVTFALSLANHLFAVASAWSLGIALGLKISATDYLAVIPLVNAVAAVPITPGGAGVRETASVALLSVAGATSAQATALSLLVYGVIVVWALLGGVCYLALRKREP